jgi:hypothetical protein
MAAATDEERRVRALDRLGEGVVVGDRVVLAVVGERPVAEAAREDRVGWGPKGRPIASYSSFRQPAPRATSTRPPLS